MPRPCPPNTPDTILCITLMLFALPVQADPLQTIASDPKLMQKVLDMAQDPNVQTIINNEKIMQAIRSGNLDLLANTPEIQQLMRHPVVQEIKSKEKKH
ncbi:MAG: hypothetical protein HQL96_15210 [Magnetococcales bacterium]|nr:hypothetical protein [Magnetococcales bacterium]